MTDTAIPPRDHALDNLRAAVVFLVVVLHAIISYMEFAPPWWYVLDPQRSIVFTYMVLLIDVPIMQIMFFLAGYFALPSLAKRGPGRFFADKIRRIGIPWAIGVLLLAPPTAYIIYYSRHSPMSLATFWRTDFWGPAYQQSVYWYLGVLLALFALLAAGVGANPRLAARAADRRRPAAWQGALFVVAVTAAAIPIAGRYDLDFWSNNHIFVYQPVRLPNYLAYFFLGVFAGRRGWFAPDGWQPRLALWLPLSVASGAIYAVWRMSPHPELSAFETKAAAVALFNLFCFAALFAAIALARRCLSGGGGFWSYQARNSYGVYYLHPLILYPLALALALVPLALSPFLKAAILVALSYALSLLASGLLLTRLPGLRRMF